MAKLPLWSTRRIPDIPGDRDPWAKAVADALRELDFLWNGIDMTAGSGSVGPAGPAGVAGPAGPAGPAGGVSISRKLNADQSIGNVAAVLTWTKAGVATPIALAANKKYRFRCYIMYENGTTTATHSCRVTYSGTLKTTADCSNVFNAWGTTGAPAGSAATPRQLTRQINGVIISVVSMFGNTGVAGGGIVAVITIDGVICTDTAGTLDIECLSSIAAGMAVQGATRIDVYDVDTDEG